jgi:uncharacterized membrane protein
MGPVAPQQPVATTGSSWCGATVQSRFVSTLRRRAPLALAAAFTASGVVHLVRPQVFASIMPRLIPGKHHTNLIYVSGLAELACAAGLIRRNRWAPAASVAVLAAVFPANVQMALDAGSGRNAGAADNRALAYGRLPLQLAMAWAALQARPEARPG